MPRWSAWGRCSRRPGGPDRPPPSCDPSYPTLCIPPAYEVGDLDCADVGATWFTVLAPDGHGFDADYDGYGCEG